MIQRDQKPVSPVAIALVGAAVGLAAALLYAPRSGAETRFILREWLERRKDGINYNAEQAKASLESLRRGMASKP